MIKTASKLPLDIPISLSFFSKEEEEITKKYFDVLNKKEELGKKVKVVTNDKEKLEQEIEKIQANFRLSSSNIHSKEQELKELEIKNTRMSVRMDTLLNTLSETYEMTFEKARADYILEISKNYINYLEKVI